MSPIKTVSFAVLASLAVACGGSSNSGGSDPATSTAASASDYCGAYCARVNQCDSTQSVSACNSQCTSVNAVSMPKLRADVVAASESCEKNAACSSILDGSAQRTCVQSSVAAIAPSGAATAFCQAYGDAASKCGNSVDQAQCLDAAKPFTDGTLDGAQACMQKACADLDACVKVAFAESQ